jgi:hypothetical protein
MRMRVLKCQFERPGYSCRLVDRNAASEYNLNADWPLGARYQLPELETESFMALKLRNAGGACRRRCFQLVL